MTVLRLDRCAAVEDLRDAARARVPRIAFDYLDGGAGDEAALRRNRAALDAITLTPRALVDVATRSTAVELFGRRYAAPNGTAPIGLVNFVTAGGDRQVAMAAAALALRLVMDELSRVMMMLGATRLPLP